MSTALGNSLTGSPRGIEMYSSRSLLTDRENSSSGPPPAGRSVSTTAMLSPHHHHQSQNGGSSMKLGGPTIEELEEQEQGGFGLVQMYDLISNLDVTNVHVLDAVVLGNRSEPKGMYSSQLNYLPKAKASSSSTAKVVHDQSTLKVNYAPNWPSEDVEEQQVKRLFLIKRETTEAARGRLLLRHMTHGLSSSDATAENFLESQSELPTHLSADTRLHTITTPRGTSPSTPTISYEDYPAALHLEEVPIPQKNNIDGSNNSNNADASESQAAEIAVKVTCYDVGSLEGAVARRELKKGILLKYPRNPAPAHHNLIRIIFTPYITKVEYHENEASVIDPAVPLKQRINTNIRSQGVTIVKPTQQILNSADKLCDSIFESFRNNGVLVRMAVYYCMHIGDGVLVLMWVGKMEVRPVDPTSPMHTSSPASSSPQRGSLKYNQQLGSSTTSRLPKASSTPLTSSSPNKVSATGNYKSSSPATTLSRPTSAAIGGVDGSRRGPNSPVTLHPTTVAPPSSPIQGPAAVDQKINELHEIKKFGFYTQTTTKFEVFPVGIRAQLTGYVVVQDHRLDYQASPVVDPPLTLADRDILDICKKHNRWSEAVALNPDNPPQRPFGPQVEPSDHEHDEPSTPRSETPEDPDFPDLERNAQAWQIHSKEMVDIRRKYGNRSLEKEERSYVKTVKSKRSNLINLRPSTAGSNHINKTTCSYGARSNLHGVSSIHRSRTGGGSSALQRPAYQQQESWKGVCHRDFNTKTKFHPNESKRGTIATSAVESLIRDQAWKPGVTRKNVQPVQDGSLMHYLTGCEHMTSRPKPAIKLVDLGDISGRGLERRHQLYLGRVSTNDNDTFGSFNQSNHSGGDIRPMSSASGVRINAALPPAPVVEFANTHQSLSEEMLRANKKKGYLGRGSSSVLEQLFGPLGNPRSKVGGTTTSSTSRPSSASHLHIYDDGDPLASSFGNTFITRDPSRVRLRPLGTHLSSSASISREGSPRALRSSGAGGGSRGFASNLSFKDSSTTLVDVGQPTTMDDSNHSTTSIPKRTMRASFLSAGISTSPSRVRHRSSILDDSAQHIAVSTDAPRPPSSLDDLPESDRFGAAGIIKYSHHIADTIDDLIYRAQCGQGEAPPRRDSGGHIGAQPPVGDRSASIRITIPTTITDEEECRDVLALMLAAGFSTESPLDTPSPKPTSNHSNNTRKDALKKSTNSEKVDNERDADGLFNEDGALLVDDNDEEAVRAVYSQVLRLPSNSVYLARARDCLRLFCRDVEALFQLHHTMSSSAGVGRISGEVSGSLPRLGNVKKLVIAQGYSFVEAMLSCHPGLMDRV